MFSLIIAIISIALVVALVALSQGYFGSVSDADAQAQAARLKNEEQQILGAATFFQADNHRWPTDLQELQAAGYLTSVPRGTLAATSPSLISAAYAQAVSGWSTPTANLPVYVTSGAVAVEVCRAYNRMTRGDDGVLRQPYASLTAQCYGANGDYRVVVSKAADVLTQALGAEVATSAVPARGSAGDAWDVVPGGKASPPVPEQPDEPAPAVLAVDLESQSLTFGDVELPGTALSPLVTLRNDGDAKLTGLAVDVPSGFSLVQSDCSAELGGGQSCSFRVQFSPAEPIAYEGQVSISSSAGSRLVGAAGRGYTLAQVNVSPSPLNFGRVKVGQSRTLDVTLRNTGSEPAAGFELDLPAGYTWAAAGAAPCASTLAGGESCTLAVTYAPGRVETSAAVASLTYGSAGQQRAPTPLQLTAEAYVPGSLVVSPPVLAFGDVQTGTSRTLPLSYGNPGSEPVTLSAPNVPAGFVVVPGTTGNPCGSTLAGGASCSMEVKFTPAAVTTYNAVVTSNYSNSESAFNSAQTSVSGRGVAPSATLSNLTFGTGTVYGSMGLTARFDLQVTNTGLGPITVGAATISGAGLQSVTGGTCTQGGTLAAGQSCTVAGTFTPSKTGVGTGSAQVATSAGTKTLALQTEGVEQKGTFDKVSHSFGTVSGPVETVFKLTNTGKGYLSATWYYGFGDTPAFTLVNNSCDVPGGIAPGATCDVRVRFSPTAAGTYNSWMYAMGPTFTPGGSFSVDGKR